MKTILLGRDRKTGRDIRIPESAFHTHLHLVGGTGKGKTTALHTMLQPLMMNPIDPPAFFVFDRLGGFSSELLRWMASDFCTTDVRERLVYIEPAREDVVLGFNPLLYRTEAEGYFKVARATEIVLRAWQDVNIDAMPRLARWTFNAFWAAAQLGLTIADCQHLLLPGSGYHRPLLTALPLQLQAEWSELLRGAGGRDVGVMLESSRNRLKPFFESVILRRMFGATTSRLDVLRFMQNGRIVLINLAPLNRVPQQLADAIGALILNEILATARSLPGGAFFPTYLVLDEFQNFVGPDIEAALPEVRQLGLRLILSHQSFSQLKRGDLDLTSMIFQAQSRLIFGVQGEDADLLAHELASITFDPRNIKDEIYSRRQRVSGHTIMELSSTSTTEALAKQWKQDYGTSEAVGRGSTSGGGTSASSRHGQGETHTGSTTHGSSQHLLPDYEEFVELSNRTFMSFDEQRSLWAQAVRGLPTGHGVLRLVNDPALHEVNVKRSAVGHLGWSTEQIAQFYPEALDDVEALKEANFASDLFVTPEVIDRETEQRLAAILRPPIRLPDPQKKALEQKPETRDATDGDRSSAPQERKPDQQLPFD